MADDVSGLLAGFIAHGQRNFIAAQEQRKEEAAAQAQAAFWQNLMAASGQGAPAASSAPYGTQPPEHLLNSNIPPPEVAQPGFIQGMKHGVDVFSAIIAAGGHGGSGGAAVAPAPAVESAAPNAIAAFQNKYPGASISLRDPGTGQTIAFGAEPRKDVEERQFYGAVAQAQDSLGNLGFSGTDADLAAIRATIQHFDHVGMSVPESVRKYATAGMDKKLLLDVAAGKAEIDQAARERHAYGIAGRQEQARQDVALTPAGGNPPAPAPGSSDVPSTGIPALDAKLGIGGAAAPGAAPAVPQGGVRPGETPVGARAREAAAGKERAAAEAPDFKATEGEFVYPQDSPKAGQPIPPNATPAQRQALGAIRLSRDAMMMRPQIARLYKFIEDMKRASDVINTEETRLGQAGKAAGAAGKYYLSGSGPVAKAYQDLQNTHGLALNFVRDLGEKGRIAQAAVDTAEQKLVGPLDTKTTTRSKLEFYAGFAAAMQHAVGIPLGRQQRELMGKLDPNTLRAILEQPTVAP